MQFAFQDLFGRQFREDIDRLGCQLGPIEVGRCFHVLLPRTGSSRAATPHWIPVHFPPASAGIIHSLTASCRIPFAFEYRLGVDPTLRSTRATSSEGGPVASSESGECPCLLAGDLFAYSHANALITIISFRGVVNPSSSDSLGAFCGKMWV